MAILDTLLAGGLTGLLGNLATTIFGFVNKKQENKHEFAMKKLGIESMEREAKMNIQVTETKVQGDIELAEMQSFNESIKQNAVDKLTGDVLTRLFDHKWTIPFGVLITFLFGLVDFVKALIRPGITLYLTIAMTVIYFNAMDIIKMAGGVYDVEMATELFNQITQNILYVGTSCIMWWFGDRRLAKTMNKNKF
jgi:hypothetical protein